MGTCLLKRATPHMKQEIAWASHLSLQLRLDSEVTLKQEIAWASHLSLQVIISGRSNHNVSQVYEGVLSGYYAASSLPFKYLSSSGLLLT